MIYAVRHIETGAIHKTETIEQYDAEWELIGLVPDDIPVERAMVIENGDIVDDLEPVWQFVRNKRDKLLIECDKYMLPDFPITEEKRSEWASYRQALRDLPEVTGDPTSPSWPVPPA